MGSGSWATTGSCPVRAVTFRVEGERSSIPRPRKTVWRVTRPTTRHEHSGSGYPETCLTCHQVTTWTGATVDHGAVSGGFALPVDHETLGCTSCHTPDGTGTLFSPTSADDCVACHQADFQREHSGSGYPDDCTVCHTTSGWDGATTDHTALSNGFGLLGNHGILPCTSCHIPGGGGTLFDPTTPEDCVACHQTDYQAQHSGSGYPERV